MSTHGRATALLALLLAIPALAAAQAQTELPREGKQPYQRHPEAVKAIDQLKSPYCPGFMLEVCPSPNAAALRDSIEELADQGWPSDSIVEWMLARNGQEWRALPKREGKALIAWLMPPFAVLVGVLLVVLALRRMRGSHPPVSPRSEELTAEEEAKLKKALQDLEAEEEAPFL